MKIKKEYIILIIVIAALSGYLYFQRADRVHYELPDVSAIDEKEITRIEIASGQESIKLNKKDGTWHISEQEYPADAKKTEDMLRVFKDLAITDLVSESKNYILYDLGDAEKITVKAYAGSNLVRGFDIGKKAPTNKHTFIKLEGDDKVYQAGGNLKKDFETTVADLRDKRVLAFSTGEITGLTIAASQKEITLTKEDIPAEEAGQQAGKEAKKSRWKDGSGNTIEDAAVDKLLGTLSALDCEEYLEDKAKTDLGLPETTITLNGTREYSLSLFAGEGEKKPASSSENEYVFILPDYNIDSIDKSIEELLGLPGKS